MKKIVVLKRLNVLCVKILKQLKATQPVSNSKKMKRIAELIRGINCAKYYGKGGENGAGEKK